MNSVVAGPGSIPFAARKTFATPPAVRTLSTTPFVSMCRVTAIESSALIPPKIASFGRSWDSIARETIVISRSITRPARAGITSAKPHRLGWARCAAANASRTKYWASGASLRTIIALAIFSGFASASASSSAKNRVFSSRITSPAFIAWIASIAALPNRLSTYRTGRPKSAAIRSAWDSIVVKSSFPGRLWWARTATRASRRSRIVARCSRIRASFRRRPVAGSIGELMSTRSRTVDPARPKSSIVKKSRPIGAANGAGAKKLSVEPAARGNAFHRGPRCGSGMPLRERDLLGPVASHFQDLRYVVYGEVEIAGRWADLVAVSDEEVVAVELKLRAWREAIRQAIAYQLGADRSFVALPLARAQDAHRHRFAFEREGVGLLAVDASARVRTVLPAASSPRRMPFIADDLRRDLAVAASV